MTIIHGFRLIKEQEIAELNILARLFTHEKTCAELLSLSNDDENKVFGITFKTPPSDSTGAAHILEHSVLCGSRKYPVKEPFVELLKGSLQTFLNAFTYPDKTCYPVASQNVKDFYNLIDVYLDAVFYPRLTPHIFEQEGWHYELQNPNDPLSYKGVVFNEMKGAYSSPEQVLSKYT
ncbi:MAG: peptidase M16, partial [Thermoplasmata archaeon]